MPFYPSIESDLVARKLLAPHDPDAARIIEPPAAVLAHAAAVARETGLAQDVYVRVQHWPFEDDRVCHVEVLSWRLVPEQADPPPLTLEGVWRFARRQGTT